MLQSARLNDLVILQQVQEGKDSFGGTTTTWVEVAQAWADIQPIRGKEFFESFQVQVEVTFRIRVRYRDDVVPKMRVLFGTRIFTIEYVIDVGERHELLELMCAEGPKEE
jgi:SPP1 family predicted phage head-tail adaptor